MKCSITVFALVVISLFTPLVYAQDVASQGGSPMGTDMDEKLSRMQKDMSAYAAANIATPATVPVAEEHVRIKPITI
jgi:hypothetical protein